MPLSSFSSVSGVLPEDATVMKKTTLSIKHEYMYTFFRK